MGRRDEKFTGMLHECCGDLASEMRFAARLEAAPTCAAPKRCALVNLLFLTREVLRAGSGRQAGQPIQVFGVLPDHVPSEREARRLTMAFDLDELRSVQFLDVMG